VERIPHTGTGPYIPFAADPDKAPPFLPIGGKTLVRQTSSTHGPDGYITIDPQTIADMQQRLHTKLGAAMDRIALYEENMVPDTDTLVISYGITCRAVTDAARALAANGRSVSTLSLKTLWPVPEALLLEKAARFKRIVVIEMNLGQYVNEIRRVLCGKPVDFYGQMNGILIPPAKIMEAIEND